MRHVHVQLRRTKCAGQGASTHPRHPQTKHASLVASKHWKAQQPLQLIALFAEHTFTGKILTAELLVKLLPSDPLPACSAGSCKLRRWQAAQRDFLHEAVTSWPDVSINLALWQLAGTTQLIVPHIPNQFQVTPRYLLPQFGRFSMRTWPWHLHPLAMRKVRPWDKATATSRSERQPYPIIKVQLSHTATAYGGQKNKVRGQKKQNSGAASMARGPENKASGQKNKVARGQKPKRPRRNFHLPTIHFQVWTVSFREGNS